MIRKRESYLSVLLAVTIIIQSLMGFNISLAVEYGAFKAIDKSVAKVGDEITLNYTYQPEKIPVPVLGTAPNKEVVVVMDISGSMNQDLVGNWPDEIAYDGTSRMSITKSAAQNFLRQLSAEPNVKVSVVPYSFRAEVVNGLGDLVGISETSESTQNEENLSYLSNSINGFVAEGGTNIGDGLRRAYYVLEGSQDYDADKYIILLTDGEPTGASIDSVNGSYTTTSYGHGVHYKHQETTQTITESPETVTNIADATSGVDNIVSDQDAIRALLEQNTADMLTAISENDRISLTILNSTLNKDIVKLMADKQCALVKALSRLSGFVSDLDSTFLSAYSGAVSGAYSGTSSYSSDSSGTTFTESTSTADMIKNKETVIDTTGTTTITETIEYLQEDVTTTTIVVISNDGATTATETIAYQDGTTATTEITIGVDDAMTTTNTYTDGSVATSSSTISGYVELLSFWSQVRQLVDRQSDEFRSLGYFDSNTTKTAMVNEHAVERTTLLDSFAMESGSLLSELIASISVAEYDQDYYSDLYNFDADVTNDILSDTYTQTNLDTVEMRNFTSLSNPAYKYDSGIATEYFNAYSNLGDVNQYAYDYAFDYAKQMAALSSEIGINNYYIAFSKDADTNKLAAIAQEGNATYLEAGDDTVLNNVYNEIVQEITGEIVIDQIDVMNFEETIPKEFDIVSYSEGLSLNSTGEKHVISGGNLGPILYTQVGDYYEADPVNLEITVRATQKGYYILGENDQTSSYFEYTPVGSNNLVKDYFGGKAVEVFDIDYTDLTAGIKVTNILDKTDVTLGDEIIIDYSFQPQPIDSADAVVELNRGKEVVIVMDSSGSMSASNLADGQSRLEAARASALSFLKQLKADDDDVSVAFIDYNAYADIKVNDNNEKLMDIKNVNNYEYLVNSINDFNTDDGTNIGDGLRRAYHTLLNSENPYAKKIIVLMTDGEPTAFSADALNTTLEGNTDAHYYSNVTETTLDTSVELDKNTAVFANGIENGSVVFKQTEGFANNFFVNVLLNDIDKYSYNYAREMAALHGSREDDININSYYIAFSSGAGVDVLNNIAQEGDATVKVALDASALDSVYEEISVEIERELLLSDIYLEETFQDGLEIVSVSDNLKVDGQTIRTALEEGAKIEYKLNSTGEIYEAEPINYQVKIKVVKQGDYKVGTEALAYFAYKDLDGTHKKANLTEQALKLPIIRNAITGVTRSFPEDIARDGEFVVGNVGQEHTLTYEFTGESQDYSMYEAEIEVTELDDTIADGKLIVMENVAYIETFPSGIKVVNYPDGMTYDKTTNTLSGTVNNVVMRKQIAEDGVAPEEVGRYRVDGGFDITVQYTTPGEKILDNGRVTYKEPLEENPLQKTIVVPTDKVKVMMLGEMIKTVVRTFDKSKYYVSDATAEDKITATYTFNGEALYVNSTNPVEKFNRLTFREEFPEDVIVTGVSSGLTITKVLATTNTYEITGLENVIGIDKDPVTGLYQVKDKSFEIYFKVEKLKFATYNFDGPGDEVSYEDPNGTNGTKDVNPSSIRLELTDDQLPKLL